MAALAALQQLLVPMQNIAAAILAAIPPPGAPPPPPPPGVPIPLAHDYEPQQFTTAANPVEMTMTIINCQYQIKLLEQSKVKSMDSPEYQSGDKFGIFYMEFSTLLDKYDIRGEATGAITEPIAPPLIAAPDLFFLHNRLSYLWNLKKQMVWLALTKAFRNDSSGYTRCDTHQRSEAFLAFQALCHSEFNTQGYNIEEKHLEYMASAQHENETFPEFSTKLTQGQALLATQGITVTQQQLIAIFIKGIHQRHFFCESTPQRPEDDTYSCNNICQCGCQCNELHVWHQGDG